MRERPRKQSTSVNIYTLGNVILNHCMKLGVFHSLCTFRSCTLKHVKRRFENAIKEIVSISESYQTQVCLGMLALVINSLLQGHHVIKPANLNYQSNH